MKLPNLMQIYHTEFHQNWYSTLDAEVNLTYLLGGDGGRRNSHFSKYEDYCLLGCEASKFVTVVDHLIMMSVLRLHGIRI
jgi:hypothetical protein